MSYCESAPVARPLNYCSGTIHVGMAFPYLTEVPIVVMTNVASGRQQMVPVDEDQLPYIEIEQPDDLSPGQLYRIEVMGSTEDEGMVPIAFYTFAFDQATGQWNIVDDSVDAVQVRFVKLNTPEGVHSHEEQWITL